MTLKERITEDMKTAMRAGEKERLGTIRLALAAIKQREVDERIVLDDAQVLAVLEKMIKQRKEAITQFQAGGRADLVAKETAEVTLLEAYLPARLSDAELDALIARRHRLDGRHLRQGHGQGDGAGKIPVAGPSRHGRGQLPREGEAGRTLSSG